MSLLHRLGRIARAYTEQLLRNGALPRHGAPRDTSGRFEEDFRARGTERARAGDPVSEDLAVFGLQPPSSFKEVRAARNREAKKYHADRYMKEPDKLKAANEIMQIYNAAYARLKSHFEKQPR